MRLFTKEDLEFIKSNYLTMNHRELATHLKVKESSIRYICSHKKWRRKVPDWTKEEELILKDHYNSTVYGDLDELLKKLPTKLKSNICRKARALGLTNKNRPLKEDHIAGIGKRTKERIAEKGHPRGMLGRNHSEETRKIFSKINKERWADPNYVLRDEKHLQAISDRMMIQQRTRPVLNQYCRSKSGRRDDLNNMYVRSSWEANYARYLNYLLSKNLIKKWEYEKDVFYFDKIKRGTRSYLPDFKVYTNDDKIEYHEIKGWMDQKSKTKLKRMEKYYPRIKIILIQKKEYELLKKQMIGVINNWE